MKGFAATIGYDTYLIQPGDIGPLFEIASRSVMIEQTNWQEPHHPAADGKPFVTDIKLIDFEQKRPAEQDAGAVVPVQSPDSPDDIVF